MGGKIERVFARDASLRETIEACKDSWGHFTFSGEVFTAFDRVLRKTAQGLYYGLYGRVPPLHKFELLSIEHSDYETAQEVVKRLRRPAFRDLTDHPFPQLSKRGLPNIYVVQSVITDVETGESRTLSENVFHDTRQREVDWTVYQETTLHFTFPR